MFFQGGLYLAAEFALKLRCLGLSLLGFKLFEFIFLLTLCKLRFHLYRGNTGYSTGLPR